MAINQHLKDIADEIIKALMVQGFIIHRYDAYSTNSIYLKLDYGVCNSIRISDHEGKAYLKYRYNIGPHIPNPKATQGTYKRYYYPDHQIKSLINRIKKDKNEKLEKYGSRYVDFMSKNKREHANSKGFWQQSWLIKTVPD